MSQSAARSLETDCFSLNQSWLNLGAACHLDSIATSLASRVGLEYLMGLLGHDLHSRLPVLIRPLLDHTFLVGEDWLSTIHSPTA